ncbi:MAG: hypothetical protein QM764_15080 [Chitinophagaceae bacterium]
MIKNITLCFIATALFASCTMTTTKSKTPTFNKPTDSLQIELNKVVSCEGINLDGKEITRNGKTNSELEIDVTNGQNIPSDENQMSNLGRQVAIIIKASLQDKSEYDSYKVLFITKKESGGVTQRTWKGKIFKAQEL